MEQKQDVGYIKGALQFSVPSKEDYHKTISYSQFSLYQTCPRHWKLKYIDKIRPDLPSIALLFGTAFHETLQEYLKVLFNDSPGAADKFGVREVLQQQMEHEYIRLMEDTGGEIFTSKQEMEEAYRDGVAILDFVTKKRRVYFNRKDYELVAIEMPIYQQASEKNKNVFMNGFVDVILRDKFTGKYVIIDIKTSMHGWNKWMKADKGKTSQLLIYKKYFAEQIGCDIKDIDVKYFIVRRKLPEDSMYPIKRVSEFVPASGKPSINKVIKDVDAFVEHAFNEDGSYNTDREYIAIQGKGGKHCKYCPFKDNMELCPRKDRMK